MDEASELARLTSFVVKISGGNARNLKLKIRPLRRGLVSESVREVSARYIDEFGKPRVFRFVAKRVHGSVAREVSIYEALSSTSLRRMVPSVLGVARAGGRPTHLYLEAVAQDVRWPWANVAIVTRLLDRLAHVHAPEHVRLLKAHVSDWDYDAELGRVARETLELAERTEIVARLERKTLPAVRRLVQDIGRIRREILNLRLLPAAVLHGDLHPGNVVVRWRAGENEPVLIDWARARYGSPLEDVSSWLQSLAAWEPEVQRRHDTLLGAYLGARGLPAELSRELRHAYWLASAVNCFAGAMYYHMAVAEDRAVGRRARTASEQALRQQLRILRRADNCWSA